jgi:hypothetical protein
VKSSRTSTNTNEQRRHLHLRHHNPQHHRQHVRQRPPHRHGLVRGPQRRQGSGGGRLWRGGSIRRTIKLQVQSRAHNKLTRRRSSSSSAAAKRSYTRGSGRAVRLLCGRQGQSYQQSKRVKESEYKLGTWTFADRRLSNHKTRLRGTSARIRVGAFPIFGAIRSSLYLMIPGGRSIVLLFWRQERYSSYS